MTEQVPPRRIGRGGTALAGWVFSLTLHTAVGLGALLFLQQTKPAQEPELFTWNVAVVTPGERAEINRSPEPPSPPQESRSPTPIMPPPLPPPSSPLSSSSNNSLPLAPPQPPATIIPSPPKKVGPSDDLASTPAIESDHESSAVVPPSNFNPIEQSQKQDPIASPGPAQPSLSQAPERNTETLPPNPNNLIASKQAGSATSDVLQPPEHPAPSRQDFGWLMETILQEIEPLKRYPANARLERAEGKVVVKMVIHDNGQISDIEVFKSSGYSSLDQAAIDVFRLASPIPLSRPLGKPSLTVRIPMNYAMDRP